MTSLLCDEGASPPKLLEKRQLLNHIVDGIARYQPNSLYAEYPISLTSYDQGFRKITYEALANAVNGLAWLIYDALGPGVNFLTLAYVGPNDVRYTALILAAIKAGYKLLLTSPRNSVPAHQSLFRATDCKVLLTTSPQPPFVKPILAACDVKTLEIPGVEELLGKTYPHFLYEKSFEEGKDDPLVVLHTSGTTGLPKPIVWTQDWAASFKASFTDDVPDGFVTQFLGISGTRMFVTLPPFHAAGVVCLLLCPLLLQTKPILPLAGVFPSAQLVMDSLKHTKADSAFLAPPFLVEMSNSPELSEFITKSVEEIFYAGGAIPREIGDALADKTRLWSIIGMTEAGVLPGIRPAGKWVKEDWNCVRFPPHALIEFEHQSEDLYEAVIHRHPDPEKVQPVFKVFPHVEAWRTKDLYSPHPTKPGLWLSRGRADDIIIFLNGEKTNPLSMEQYVSSHPEITTALVVGTLKLQAALLVELATDQSLSISEKAAVIERIWPTIQEANQECPHHAKISKSHILFTHPDRPMPRAGKGTIQRQPTLVLYQKEIEALYSDADVVSTPSDSNDAVHINTSNHLDVLKFVQDAVKNVTGSILEETDDFFASGMDSLQALQLTRSLKRGLGLTELHISTVYLNPSIILLTEAILNLAMQNTELDAAHSTSRREKLESILAKYKDLVDEVIKAQKPSSHTNGVKKSGRSVVLTGSTGALGCYLLEKLMYSPDISHIYCLNRAADPVSLQFERSNVRGLQTTFPHSKVTLLTVDLSKPELGLDHSTYTRIVDSTTEIIHTAWPVNFNLSLSTFTPQLDGIVNLLALAATSVHSASLTFISSISSVASAPFPIPETVLEDTLAPLPMGYAESKYLAERILDYAESRIPTFNTKIIRVGQIAGPALTSGSWNKWEWLPSLIISSAHLGALPETLGSAKNVVDWIPIDILASILIELALHSPEARGGVQFFHPQNPEPVTWSSLLPSIVDTLSKDGKTVEIIPFSAWLQRIRADAEVLKDGDLEKSLQANPAIKLIPFYESLVGEMPVMDGELALARSEELRELKGIDGPLMQKWIGGWL